MSGNGSLNGGMRGVVGRLLAAGLAMVVVVSIATSATGLTRRPLSGGNPARLATANQADRAGTAPGLSQNGSIQAAPNAPVTINLCAKAGTLDLPGLSNMPIWGFALKPADAACSDASVKARLPGPTLEVNEGDLVTIVLHNEVPGQNVSLLLTGQDLFPDEEGVAPGGSRSYTFTADDPGTYLYESGAGSPRTVPMGLYGPLIVRSGTPNQAYDDPVSTFDDEAVVLLSEIDPDLNANPESFDLVDFAPKYWLINGRAYPDTGTLISVSPGKLLLRYLNAGVQHHTIALLGAHQRVVAKDAYLTPFPFDVVGETIPSGGTADLITSIPPTVRPLRFPLFSRQLHLSNDRAAPGGMLTFIDVVVPGGANQPPVVDVGPDKIISPNTLPAVTSLSATVTDDGRPSDNVSTTWTKQSGPGSVTFGDASAGNTTATVSVPGTYVLRVTADDGDLSAFDEITVTIQSPSIHVGDLDRMSFRISTTRWRAQVTITVHNANHAPVAGVTVRGRWSAGDISGRTLSCVTNAAGRCSVQSGRLFRSSNLQVTFTVTGLKLQWYVYRPASNHDRDRDSNGTAIIVKRR
jgi:FtsP/CotA-like multicopper oxidase with cupredoxin domain